MTTKIYVSTDAYELESIVDNEIKNYSNRPKEIQDISIQEGEKIKKKIDFNPMAFMEFGDEVDINYLSKFSNHLHKDKYYNVSLENGKASKSFVHHNHQNYNLKDEINAKIRRHSKWNIKKYKS